MKAETTYARDQVDRAFYYADEHVVFTDINKMQVDGKSMLASGMSPADISIVEEYVELHNELIDALVSGNQTQIETSKNTLIFGAFKHVFDDTVASSVGPSGQTDVNFWSETACGITNGEISTYPPTPVAHIGEDGHDTESSIRVALSAKGLHVVNWPWADWGDIVYAEKNLTGTPSCNEGEFRDEHHVYDGTSPHPYGNTGRYTAGWHTLIHHNEPNPELLDYPHPTYWWAGFTQYWHDLF